MRMYAHFLGYSAAEGGIVEIFTQETFDIGSIDVVSMEHDFDDFEFNCKWSSIFEKMPSNSETFQLKTKLGGGLASSIVNSENTFILDGSRTLNINEYIWIENERIKILDNAYNIGGVDYYLGGRAQNGSLSTSHFINTNFDGTSNIFATTKRVSPIGMIVKIYRSDDVVLAYGQVTGCSLDGGSGTVTVSCSHLYNQLDQKITVEVIYNVGTIANVINFGYLDFFGVLAFNGLDINLEFKSELSPDGLFCTFSDMKKAFSQLLSVNNMFLSFNKNTGFFELKKLRRLIGKEEPNAVLLCEKTTANNGAISVELFPHISSATLNTPDGEALTLSSFDSNYTKEYTQGQDVTIDFSGLVNNGAIDYEEIAKSKLFFLSNVIERLSISVSRYDRRFDIGQFYSFLDLYRIRTFLNSDNDNVFLCVSQDETKCNFIRVLAYRSSLVAPAVIVKKTGFGEFTFIGDNYLSALDFITSTVVSNGLLQEVLLETLTNPSTGFVIFEVGDEVTMCSVDGVVERPDIVSISGNVVVLTSDFGSVGDVYIMSIESNKTFSALENKNKAYIYEGEGVL